MPRYKGNFYSPEAIQRRAEELAHYHASLRWWSFDVLHPMIGDGGLVRMKDGRVLSGNWVGNPPRWLNFSFNEPWGEPTAFAFTVASHSVDSSKQPRGVDYESKAPAERRSLL